MTPTEAIQQVIALIAKWRTDARHDVRHGVKHSLDSHREHFGGINYGLAKSECADELSALLSAIEGARTTDEHEKELDTRVDEPAAGAPPTGSTAPSNEVVPTIPTPDTDSTCEHGVAWDVHCCGCHSGFIFDSRKCVCF